MKKITVLVAHQNKEIKDKVINSINSLNFTEVVGTSTDGMETYNKIVNLKPELVFMNEKLEEMNSLEIMRLSKKKLEKETPLFNILIEENEPCNDEQFVHDAKQIGNFNALIRIPDEENIVSILTNYKKYENK